MYGLVRSIEVKILLRDISMCSASTIGDALLSEVLVIGIGIVQYQIRVSKSLYLLLLVIFVRLIGTVIFAGGL
jgi:hypothetical protein